MEQHRKVTLLVTESSPAVTVEVLPVKYRENHLRTVDGTVSAAGTQPGLWLCAAAVSDSDDAVPADDPSDPEGKAWSTQLWSLRWSHTHCVINAHTLFFFKRLPIYVCTWTPAGYRGLACLLQPNSELQFDNRELWVISHHASSGTVGSREPCHISSHSDLGGKLPSFNSSVWERERGDAADRQ